MYFALIPRNHNEYQTKQSRSCLIYQEHEVELIFYSLFIDSPTPLIFFHTIIMKLKITCVYLYTYQNR